MLLGLKPLRVLIDLHERMTIGVQLRNWGKRPGKHIGLREGLSEVEYRINLAIESIV